MHLFFIKNIIAASYNYNDKSMNLSNPNTENPAVELKNEILNHASRPETPSLSSKKGISVAFSEHFTLKDKPSHLNISNSNQFNSQKSIYGKALFLRSSFFPYISYYRPKIFSLYEIERFLMQDPNHHDYADEFLRDSENFVRIILTTKNRSQYTTNILKTLEQELNENEKEVLGMFKKNLKSAIIAHHIKYRS